MINKIKASSTTLQKLLNINAALVVLLDAKIQSLNGSR